MKSARATPNPAPIQATVKIQEHKKGEREQKVIKDANSVERTKPAETQSKRSSGICRIL